MVRVTTVEDFKKYNEDQLKRFMVSQTGIYDREIINDVVQDFYVRLIRSRALDRFNPDEKGANFSTWVCNILGWTLPENKKKNFRAQYKVISIIPDPESKGGCTKEVDVWDGINSYTDNPYYRLESGYTVSNVQHDREEESKRNIRSFIRYLETTETPEKAKKMIEYLEYRMDGLNDVAIAGIFNMTNAMMRIIRLAIQKKYYKWKRH